MGAPPSQENDFAASCMCGLYCHLPYGVYTVYMRISGESVVSHLGFTTVFILLAPPHSHEHVYILKTYQASQPLYQFKVATLVSGNSLLYL